MRIELSACLALLLTQTACVKPTPVNIFRMGDRVQVGPLIYNVFEANWRTQIEDRRPSHRFLIVHLSVTNSGAEQLSAPGLNLVDDAGHLYSESMDGQGVPSWWGITRKLKPADTLEGNILFDVDAKSYKLKLDDGSGSGPIAMVEMPLRFGLEERAMPGALDRP